MVKKIAYITDAHIDEEYPKGLGVNARNNWKTILEDIDSKNIDEVIYGGDIGEKSSNSWFFDTLQKYKVSISLGNHDYFSEVIEYYKNDFLIDSNELFYYREDDFFRFIFLDSSTDVASEKQLIWLESALVTSKKIVLFIHHPVLPIPAIIDKKFSLKGREKIQTLLEKNPNEIILFSGHYHMEDYQKFNNIMQYITPAASYQVEKDPNEIKVNNNSFGYRVIELHKDQLFTEVITFKV
ncbi:metallophosphoesterase family protein [Aquimarina sp. MMG015]|uniref:metallophosphoesterase family protein n=1 Tax=Aquimarina TaxID=290174 RepID=UPI0004286818|nr:MULTISPECIES: metallophosphoesterase [Aquimarina]AXT56117.1 metallophosphoesterase [Aquimarina sp. AD1]MBQ4803789.1 metallophosphoesterase family protein [Aquimarina sp. MMG015]RKN09523.1 metallophosphoesterase [Aquimarina sp. AD1]